MKALALALVFIVLMLASCTKPPEEISSDTFFDLLVHEQIDKVVLINNQTVEFTVKNHKEYPMGKWYRLGPLQNLQDFESMLAHAQHNIPSQNRVKLTQETRYTFLREAFNYLLPLIVLAGLVAAFFKLRRNRS